MLCNNIPVKQPFSARGFNSKSQSFYHRKKYYQTHTSEFEACSRLSIVSSSWIDKLSSVVDTAINGPKDNSQPRKLSAWLLDEGFTMDSHDIQVLMCLPYSPVEGKISRAVEYSLNKLNRTPRKRKEVSKERKGFNTVILRDFDTGYIFGRYTKRWVGTEELTSEIWGALAACVPLSPVGRIGIIGLGTGTMCHISREYFPQYKLVGYEIEEDVVRLGRKFFALGLLEDEPTEDDDVGLQVFVEDGFQGIKLNYKFSGIVVDVCTAAGGPKQLYQTDTWQELAESLDTNGRLWVNLPIEGELMSAVNGGENSTQRCLDLIEAAVGGLQVAVIDGEPDAANVLAVTGGTWDATTWREQLPRELQWVTKLEWKDWKGMRG